MKILLNPVILSVIVLYILCVKKVNVLLSLIISALLAGLCAGTPIKLVMDYFIHGMGNNAEMALSYILLGSFAAAMVHTGFSAVFSKKMTEIIGQKKFLLYIILCAVAMASQNILPIHIAFIPLLIPPLLPLMNKLKIDRRAVACILTFGLVMPYISIPAGFGLIFQKLVINNIQQNGIETTYNDNWHCFALLGLSMVIGLILALLAYRKPRVYKGETTPQVFDSINAEPHIKKAQLYTLLAVIIVTFAVQLVTNSLPLGSLVGLGLLFLLKTVSPSALDKFINEGVYMMGFVSFVILAAAGFANVLKETKSVETLVSDLLPLLPANKGMNAFLILLIGLIVTLGIGSSFGTIPIIATIFVPLCVKLNYTVPEIVILITSAAALGDAGAPVSDSTLGPTSGLAADNQHNHIQDTCIPTFIYYNIPLFLGALLAVIFGLV